MKGRSAQHERILQLKSQQMMARIRTCPDSNGEESCAASPLIGLADFHFLATISKGYSSEIILAEKKVSKKLFAVKVMAKESILDQDEISSVNVERNMFLKATQEKHPFLVHLHAAFQTETRLYFVMNYVHGGHLMFRTQRGQLTMRQAQSVDLSTCAVRCRALMSTTLSSRFRQILFSRSVPSIKVVS